MPASVHAVLAKCGVTVAVSDLFGVGGNRLLDELRIPAITPDGSPHCAG